jgi:hypothetical protein
VDLPQHYVHLRIEDVESGCAGLVPTLCHRIALAKSSDRTRQSGVGCHRAAGALQGRATDAQRADDPVQAQSVHVDDFAAPGRVWRFITGPKVTVANSSAPGTATTCYDRRIRELAVRPVGDLGIERAKSLGAVRLHRDANPEDARLAASTALMR